MVYEDGWRETRESILVDYGLQPEGHSSMARTVTLPLGVAIVKLLFSPFSASFVGTYTGENKIQIRSIVF